MHIDLLAAALWLADFLGTSVVLFFALRSRRWPSLTVLLSADLIAWVGLFLIHKHYRWYFYGYWTWTALDSALRLWVLADCLRSIPGTSFIPKNARLVLLTCAVAMAVGAGFMGYHLDGLHTAKVIRDAVVLYNRAVSFAILALSVAVFAGVALSGLGWGRSGAGVASGLGLEVAVLALRSAAFTESPPWVRALADYLANLSHLAVLAVWSSALLGPRAYLILTRRKGSKPTPHIQRRVIQHT